MMLVEVTAAEALEALDVMLSVMVPACIAVPGLHMDTFSVAASCPSRVPAPITAVHEGGLSGGTVGGIGGISGHAMAANAPKPQNLHAQPTPPALQPSPPKGSWEEAVHLSSR